MGRGLTKTALQLAEEKNNQDVVRILKTGNNKDNLNKEMIAAAGEGSGGRGLSMG